MKTDTCNSTQNAVAPGLHNQAYFDLLALQYSGALNIAASILGDADLWASHDFTTSKLCEFRKTATDCIAAIEQTPACRWMVEPILDVLNRAEKHHQHNLTMKGIAPWLL